MTSLMLALILAMSGGVPATSSVGGVERAPETAAQTGAPLGRCCFLGIVKSPVLCEVTTEEECMMFAGFVSWTEGEDCAGDPCNASCPSDCGVVDGVVDTLDLLALLAQWGGPGSCNTDDDLIVGIVDLLRLLALWGECPSIDS